MILLSEYFSDDGRKTAKVTKQGKWFVAEMVQDDKIVDHVTTFNEEEAEAAAEDWVL